MDSLSKEQLLKLKASLYGCLDLELRPTPAEYAAFSDKHRVELDTWNTKARASYPGATKLLSEIDAALAALA